MQIDHLVITARTLDEGAAAVGEMLGVVPGDGGSHPSMGTHNRLLSLGPDAYLEVIAVDPAAKSPDRTRWFGLDSLDGPPRLGAWVARCDDLAAQLGQAPMGMGDVLDLERGDLKWSMAVPKSGILPGDGVLPALIQWHGARAQSRLPESGCKLKRIVLRHPDMDRLRAEWPALALTEGIATEISAHPAIEAEIVTPRGLVSLASLAAVA